MQKINIFYVQEVLLCELLSPRTTQIHETACSLHRKTVPDEYKSGGKPKLCMKNTWLEVKITFKYQGNMTKSSFRLSCQRFMVYNQ